jgi:hypothetical protein
MLVNRDKEIKQKGATGSMFVIGFGKWQAWFQAAPFLCI